MFGCDWLTDFKKSECCAPVNISCECRAFLGQSAVRFGKKVHSRYKQVVSLCEICNMGEEKGSADSNTL